MGSNIYTRQGDKGTTSLANGERVTKDAERVEAYGTVDELSAVLGVARTTPGDVSVAATLAGLQGDLLTLSADLAAPVGSGAGIRRIEDDQVAALEAQIDGAEEELPRLTRFVLPGGTARAAHLHHARTVARRAERHVAALADAEEVSGAALAWLNRLSDLLFVLARLENARAGLEDETSG